MATQEASAALASTATVDCLVGFIFLQEGNINGSTGTVEALPKALTWQSLTTWAEFTAYNSGTELIRWTAPVIDLGRSQTFNLEITCLSTGTNTFRVFTSDTGLFEGEETETQIDQGDFDIPAFTGRYVYVTVITDADQLSRFTVQTSTETVSIKLSDIDTATLGGTNTARELEIPQPISAITDIFIQPRAATSYAVNLYVSDTANSEVVIPVVKSKSSTPTFALYGIDNDPRDAIIDVEIQALPRMAATGGGILVIT
jgi:hypothetical protein